MQGGTVASRYSRFEPRQKAIEEINEKLASKILINGKKALEKEIEVKYYDGEPTTEKENDVESEVEEDDTIL